MNNMEVSSQMIHRLWSDRDSHRRERGHKAAAVCTLIPERVLAKDHGLDGVYRQFMRPRGRFRPRGNPQGACEMLPCSLCGPTPARNFHPVLDYSLMRQG